LPTAASNPYYSAMPTTPESGSRITWSENAALNHKERQVSKRWALLALFAAFNATQTSCGVSWEHWSCILLIGRLGLTCGWLWPCVADLKESACAVGPARGGGKLLGWVDTVCLPLRAYHAQSVPLVPSAAPWGMLSVLVKPVVLIFIMQHLAGLFLTGNTSKRDKNCPEGRQLLSISYTSM